MNSGSLALAFGNRQAQTFQTAIEAETEAKRIFPQLIDCGFQVPHDFCCRLALTSINGLSAAAVEASAGSGAFGESEEPMIIFGVGGVGQIKVGSRAPEEWSKFDAFLVPAGFSSESAGEHRSVVFVPLSSTRLQTTIQTMLGIDLYQARDSRIFEPGKLDIKTDVASFEAAFRNIFSMADIFSESQVMLNASGLDDIFYRTLAIALNLETFTVNSERRLSKPSHRQLDRVCQYIMANLTRNITLTELERAGHLSRRTLHNAFYLTFQMSPMQWVREQRLLKAHRMLSKPDSDLKVTEVLYACGFANASLFSAQYLKRFGELPSMTMKRQQKTIWNLSAKFL